MSGPGLGRRKPESGCGTRTWKEDPGLEELGSGCGTRTWNGGDPELEEGGEEPGLSGVSGEGGAG